MTGNELLIRDHLETYVYNAERMKFDAQVQTEGYYSEFSYTFTVGNGRNRRDVTVKGFASCTATFGFNTWIDRRNGITACQNGGGQDEAE